MRSSLRLLATAFVFAAAASASLALTACDRGDLGDSPLERCVPEGACDPAMFQTGIKASLGDKGRGAPIFVANCARCHGPDGHGQGEAAAIDMSSAAWQASVRDATVVRTVRTGRGQQMPAFSLSDQELRDLLAHLRGLVKAPPQAPSKPPSY